MSKTILTILFALTLAVSSAAPSTNIAPAVHGLDQRLHAADKGCIPPPPGCVSLPNCGMACTIDGKDWGK
jgi:hypothetical protein